MKKLLKAIELIELNFCLITMSATTLLICATVFNRYIFHYEIMWLNDAALYIFVSFMFVAFAVCAYREGHISIDMFWKRHFGKRLRRRHRLFLVALSIAIRSSFFPPLTDLAGHAVSGVRHLNPLVQLAGRYFFSLPPIA
jgi:TRAP-type C4-dicarboxylate transport system permease small subunit